MKKIVLTAFSFFLYVLLVKAQELPEVIPTDPSIASLFKLEPSKVGEYTGTVSTTIPIYTISDIGLKIPITLSYTSGGIKVAEDASEVGLGWNLNVGGIITREIRGLDDFKDEYYSYLENTIIPDLPSVNGMFPSTTTYTIVNTPYLWPVDGVDHDYTNLGVSDWPHHDFEPDIFHFNFLGESGEFFFKKDGTIVSMEENDLKIEKTAGSNYVDFEITDSKGYKYFFGKIKETAQAIEYYTHITSWHLTRIISPSLEQIDFNYKLDSTKTTLSPIYSETVITSVKKPELVDNVPTFPCKFYKTNSPRTTVSNVNLETIVFSDRMVVFDYVQDRTDLKDALRLNSIKVLDNNSNEVLNAQLNLSYFQSISLSMEYRAPDSHYPVGDPSLRLRLDSVSVNDEKYVFDYFSNGLLPGKDSFSQDYWGYHNGELNEYLIPSDVFVRDAILPINKPLEIYSDRTPSLDYAKNFSLKKITYPTGGYTEFEFELNTYDLYTIGPNSNDGPPPASSTQSAFVSSSGSSPTNVNFNTGALTDGKMNINISMDVVTGNPYNIKHGEVYAELLDKDGNSVEKWDFTWSWPSHYWQDIDRVLVINEIINVATNSDYTLVACFNPSNTTFSNDPAFGVTSINAEWQVMGDESGEGSAVGLGGGLRIKNIKNYDSDGTLELEKAFKYDFSEDRTSGILMSNPIHSYLSTNITDNFPSQHTSYSLVPHFRTKGGLIGYREVTTTILNKNNPSISLGKEIKRFFCEGAKIISDEIWTKTYEIPSNGLLYEHEIWQSDVDSNVEDMLVKKNNWNYIINGIDAKDFTYDRLHENLNYGYGTNMRGVISYGFFNYLGKLFEVVHVQGLRLLFYPLFSNHIILGETLTTDYFETGIVENSSTFNYGTLKTFPSKKSMVNSFGQSVETNTYYPEDIQYVTDLGYDALTIPEKDAVNQLKAETQHRIATPIQVETIVKDGSTVLSTLVQRTNYKEWESGLVLPEFVQTLKGPYNETTNRLEDRIQYHSYYSNGNVKEVSKDNGFHIVYLWGYNHQYPVAKIEGADYAAVLSKLGGQTQLNALQSLDGQVLRDKLNGLRTLNAMVTTYTFDPLIGMTSATGPDGKTAYYEYDDFGRLKTVMNDEHNILKEIEYHYRGETVGDTDGGTDGGTTGGGTDPDPDPISLNLLRAYSAAYSNSCWYKILNQTYEIPDFVNLTAVVTGGSGNYTVTWSKPTTGTGISKKYFLNCPSLSIPPTSFTIEVEYTATDNDTGETKTYSTTINPPIKIISGGDPSLPQP